jgi:cytochrome c
MKFILTFAICALAISTQAQTHTPPADIQTLLSKHTCNACHKPDEKLVGPSYLEISKKKYTNSKIVNLIHSPEPANWAGYTPMMGLPNVPNEDCSKIAVWINSLNAPVKKKKK